MMKAIRITGNIFITIGIITVLSLYPNNQSDENMPPSAYFWHKKDWLVFILSYIIVAAGFLFRSIANNTYHLKKSIVIFFYMTGFFIVAILWEWQKTIPSPAGMYIAFFIYLIAFFYPLSYMFFAHIDKTETIKGRNK